MQVILPWVLLERQTGCAARQWGGWRKRRNTHWGHHTQCDWQAATQRSSVPLAEHTTRSWSGTQRRCTERRKRLLTVRKSAVDRASPDGKTTSFSFPQSGQWWLFLFPKFSIGRLTFLSKRNVFTTHIHMHACTHICAHAHSQLHTHTHTHLPLSFNYIFHIPSLWSETKENPATLTSIETQLNGSASTYVHSLLYHLISWRKMTSHLSHSIENRKHLGRYMSFPQGSPALLSDHTGCGLDNSTVFGIFCPGNWLNLQL